MILDLTHYKNNHENIGIALILNYITFKDKRTRYGTELDGKRIKKILDKYGFDIRYYEDLTKEQTIEILEKVANENHSKNDCLLVVIMSHGNEEVICTRDNPILLKNFWNPFMGNNCRTLINKPKIFIIQSCRGRVKGGITSTSNSLETSEESPIQYFLNKNQIRSKFYIPSAADLFLFFSTFEGYLSYRNEKEGSWFIQTLCGILEKCYEKKEEIDLTHIATTLNGALCHEFGVYLKRKHKIELLNKQMPNFASTLTKIFLVKSKSKN